MDKPVLAATGGKVMGDALDLWSEVSENHDSLDDYFQEYAGGRLTAEAKAIYEALLEHGPLVRQANLAFLEG